MTHHPPFNESHRGFIEAAERSRRRLHWGGGGLDIIAFSNSICERLEAQDEISGPLCLQCRQEFYSMNDLYEHQQADCWVSVSSLQYEEQWSPALYAYVRRALYPNNRAPGWTISDIIKSLEEMIMSNGRVGAVWETLDLPQRIAQPDPVVVVFRTVNQLGLTVSKIAAPLGYRGSNSSRTLTHVDGMPFVAYRDDGEMLVYSDGACSNNGQEIARGGCSFVFRCSDAVPWPWDIPQDVYSTHGGFFFRFEDVGPTNKHEQPTSNRAELRAAIAALRCIGPGQSEIRFSTPKDKSKLVVAMDSAYVVGGATKWAKVWETNGWRSSDGKAVKNQDLWEELLARVRELLSRHCAKVPFWHIPRRFNGDADRLAKYAATLKARPRFGVPSSPVTLVELSG